MSTLDDVLVSRARWTALVGDVRETLRGVPDGCAQTCVTSPPYFGLRSYDGGDAEIGREQTPREFVDALVGVMREVRRVLADDGTLWLNIGDSYSSGASGGLGGSTITGGQANQARSNRAASRGMVAGLKPKDLCGIPWRLAFALQDDGWYLRSDIVWAKPNPMPESVTDRPTRAHEYVFLLSKRARYFYDGDAIREPVAASTLKDARIGTDRVRDYDAAERDLGKLPGSRRSATNAVGSRDGRNARDVWTIAPEPFDGAHFATMPPALARRCILAGSRRGDIVLDPFGGAATTALAALREGRRALLCELNPDYVEIQRKRLADDDIAAAHPTTVARDYIGQMSLFRSDDINPQPAPKRTRTKKTDAAA